MTNEKKNIIVEAFPVILSDSQSIHIAKLIFRAYKKTNKTCFIYFFLNEGRLKKQKKKETKGKDRQEKDVKIILKKEKKKSV